MRRLPLFMAFLIASTAQAMDFGLGRSVAREGSTVIQRADDVQKQTTTGENAAASLPPCGSGAPYAILPTDLNNVTAIVPLGAVNPSGHTMPTDHIYFYLNPVDPLVPNGTRVTTTLFAPANVTVTTIASSEYLSANPPFVDYGVYFYGCREVKSYYSHIQADAALLAKAASVPKTCTTYSTGGTSVKQCRQDTNIPMLLGEVIGVSGAPHTVSFDFGTFDQRHTVTVVDHTRRPYDSDHTVCPVDYFDTPVKAQMESMLGRFDGGFHRTAAPLCGDIGYDIASTARDDDPC